MLKQPSMIFSCGNDNCQKSTSSQETIDVNDQNVYDHTDLVNNDKHLNKPLAVLVYVILSRMANIVSLAIHTLRSLIQYFVAVVIVMLILIVEPAIHKNENIEKV